MTELETLTAGAMTELETLTLVLLLGQYFVTGAVFALAYTHAYPRDRHVQLGVLTLLWLPICVLSAALWAGRWLWDRRRGA